MVVTAKAIECSQNDVVFYQSIINSSVLKRICYITRRKDHPDDGFQRLLDENRAKAISRYLDNQKMHIPTAIIISAQENAGFKFNRSKNEISFNDEDNSFLVIDGQHRLYGLKLSEKTYDFPVVIYSDLDKTDEVNLFIDINTTQKGVPAALLLDLKKLAGTETPKEEKQRDLFDLLNSDSVLAGFLLPNSSANNKISRKIFNEATSPILDVEPLKEKDVDLIYKSLKNYFEAFDYTFKRTEDERAKVNNSSIFKAICSIFPEIATRSLRDYENMKVESIIKLIEPISLLDFSKYSGSSNAIIALISREFKSAINKVSPLTEDMF